MFNKFKKIKKVTLLIFLVSTSFVTTLYANQPGLCQHPMDPLNFIDCNDIDVPIDNSLYILLGTTLMAGFYILRKKGVVELTNERG